ncbi:hypothetical protein M406DRAFT_329148 [Cryphonectria parasitica EP155]|uniref:Uncharacterized protein n=1 Tax=Cryphonectria parasitica (strain ATCC 38755 / EP155) TaxID=660469 RepID=A0A9P5CRC3_CRYP1|nr:uncharacterized protein M406DRAFT_329148 [Cryphonectria parasitica EP155]KAF3768108.1 hypothetical protein M406DRAFT_329148 [Cryphonectria parasitica EP155]
MSEKQEAQTKEAASAAEASGQAPPPQEVAQAVEAAQAARRFQDAADALKKQAQLARDPAERERLWTAAYMKEKEAHGESKKARMMASGWGQGAGIGIGISSAVGMGLGNLLGAIVTGVVAIPGGLIGSGVGAIHGPWYKLKDVVGAGGDGKTASDNSNPDGKGEASETESEDEAHMAIVTAARQMDDQTADKTNGGGESNAHPASEAKREGTESQGPPKDQKA